MPHILDVLLAYGLLDFVQAEIPLPEHLDPRVLCSAVRDGQARATRGRSSLVAFLEIAGRRAPKIIAFPLTDLGELRADADGIVLPRWHVLTSESRVILMAGSDLDLEVVSTLLRDVSCHENKRFCLARVEGRITLINCDAIQPKPRRNRRRFRREGRRHSEVRSF